jgi:WD40 repeat protein
MEIINNKRKKSFKQDQVCTLRDIAPIVLVLNPSTDDTVGLVCPLAAACICPLHSSRDIAVCTPLQVEQLQLEKVIGLSPPSAYAVSHNPAKDGVIAYSAGSVVVVYDIPTKQHVRYLQSANSGKLINCTAFSRDGRLVAGGEKGHAPCVLVWDLETGRCVAQLKGHKYGVSSLSFSADGEQNARFRWTTMLLFAMSLHSN